MISVFLFLVLKINLLFLLCLRDLGICLVCKEIFDFFILVIILFVIMLLNLCRIWFFLNVRWVLMFNLLIILVSFVVI